jgi:transcriptional regulator with XRE-family HTH domain
MENQVGERIRELRTEKGLSQADLARKLEVSPVTVYRWESGTREISLTMLGQVAAELDAELSEFFPNPQSPLFQPEDEQRRAQEAKPPPVTVELEALELRAELAGVREQLEHVLSLLKNGRKTEAAEELRELADRVAA